MFNSYKILIINTLDKIKKILAFILKIISFLIKLILKIILVILKIISYSIFVLTIILTLWIIIDFITRYTTHEYNDIIKANGSYINNDKTLEIYIKIVSQMIFNCMSVIKKTYIFEYSYCSLSCSYQRREYCRLYNYILYAQHGVKNYQYHIHFTILLSFYYDLANYTILNFIDYIKIINVYVSITKYYLTFIVSHIFNLLQFIDLYKPIMKLKHYFFLHIILCIVKFVINKKKLKLLSMRICLASIKTFFYFIKKVKYFK